MHAETHLILVPRFEILDMGPFVNDTCFSFLQNRLRFRLRLNSQVPFSMMANIFHWSSLITCWLLVLQVFFWITHLLIYIKNQKF